MAVGYGGQERRRFKRLKVEFYVTYLVQGPLEVAMRVGDRKIEATMLDLSEEGMAIKTTYDIPLGTSLLIDFNLVYAYEAYENIMQDMEIEGSIVNRAELPGSSFRLGIHFAKIKPEDRKVIIDFVKSSSK
jgi:c-di-GMP-binding flagellar brake protein YcgR